MSTPTVRLARPEEYDHVADIWSKAFRTDPLHLYFASAERVPSYPSTESYNDKNFVLFQIHLCVNSGGRCTVVDENGEIRAGTLWYPPKKRHAEWKIFSLFRAGILAPLKVWGWPAFKRAAIEYPEKTHPPLVKAYESRGIKNPDNVSWNLFSAMTDPDHQNRGLMSLLIREVYELAAPEDSLILEATTTNSRDRYARLGFELIDTVRMGEGQVSEDGLACTDKAKAVGFPIFIMVNWNPKGRGV